MVLSKFDQNALLAFAESRMNISEASRRSFISQNGLRRHLIKVRIDTGLDPFDFYDLATLVQTIKKGDVSSE